jgi:hypothetical protein
MYIHIIPVMPRQISNSASRQSRSHSHATPVMPSDLELGLASVTLPVPPHTRHAIRYRTPHTPFPSPRPSRSSFTATVTVAHDRDGPHPHALLLTRHTRTLSTPSPGASLALRVRLKRTAVQALAAAHLTALDAHASNVTRKPGRRTQACSAFHCKSIPGGAGWRTWWGRLQCSPRGQSRRIVRCFASSQH